MPRAPHLPALSIVVPILNESSCLPGLFSMLERQRGVAFEVILSDGGSSDGSLDMVGQLSRQASFPSRVLQGEKGRGRQLNAGGAAAQGETLLFLHADSDFSDPRALEKGLAALLEAICRRGDDKVAGHFALRFRRQEEKPSLAYRYYEFKARLNRPGCTHGDQGLLLTRAHFDEVGPFDESLPLLEDTRLAEAIRRQGEWLLLPAEIGTSARRFEIEGLYERQLLNALIMNFAAIGWDAFFRDVSSIYRSQDRTRRLRLLPFLVTIRKLLRALSWRERFQLWYRTGRYVRGNAWQLALARDVRRNLRLGVSMEEMSTPVLGAFDRWFDRLTDHPPGRLAAAALVWVWFQLTLFRLGLKGSAAAVLEERAEHKKEQP